MFRLNLTLMTAILWIPYGEDQAEARSEIGGSVHAMAIDSNRQEFSTPARALGLYGEQFIHPQVKMGAVFNYFRHREESEDGQAILENLEIGTFLKGLLPFQGYLKPYFRLGFSYYDTTMIIDQESESFTGDPIVISDSDQNTTIDFNTGAGLEIRVSPTMTSHLEVRRMTFSQKLFDQDWDLETLSLTFGVSSVF